MPDTLALPPQLRCLAVNPGSSGIELSVTPWPFTRLSLTLDAGALPLLRNSAVTLEHLDATVLSNTNLMGLIDYFASAHFPALQSLVLQGIVGMVFGKFIAVHSSQLTALDCTRVSERFLANEIACLPFPKIRTLCVHTNKAVRQLLANAPRLEHMKIVGLDAIADFSAPQLSSLVTLELDRKPTKAEVSTLLCLPQLRILRVQDHAICHINRTSLHRLITHLSPRAPDAADFWETLPTLTALRVLALDEESTPLKTTMRPLELPRLSELIVCDRDGLSATQHLPYFVPSCASLRNVTLKLASLSNDTKDSLLEAFALLQRSGVEEVTLHFGELHKTMFPWLSKVAHESAWLAVRCTYWQVREWTQYDALPLRVELMNPSVFSVRAD